MRKLLTLILLTCTLAMWAEDVEIGTAEQLESFAQRINNGENLNAKLIADINAGNLTPIGTSANPFRGTFDGQYHVIRLAIDKDQDYVGLIGRAAGGSTIKNLIVTGSVKGKSYTAGIVGGSWGTGEITFENCGNEANITGNTNTAGIFGVNMNSSNTINMTCCYNAGTISGTGDCAAISGWLGDGKFNLTSCYNIGEVAGGLDGKNYFARPASGAYGDCTGLEGRVNSGWTAFNADNIKNYCCPLNVTSRFDPIVIQ